MAGLGNPGERFAGTRHNSGAMVIERLSDRFAARLRKVRFLPLSCAEVTTEGVPIHLATSMAFMNESGPAIASYARRRGIPVDRVVACHDDIDLPLGALRVKRGGSTAGHHGLDSMVRAFRSGDFYRVRLGVGRPPGRQDPANFVLERFASRERGTVEAMVEAAGDAVVSLVSEGLGVTQDRYNRSGVPGV